MSLNFFVYSENLSFAQEFGSVIILPPENEIHSSVRESEHREIMTSILETTKKNTFMYTVIGCCFGRENALEKPIQATADYFHRRD